MFHCHSLCACILLNVGSKQYAVRSYAHHEARTLRLSPAAVNPDARPQEPRRPDGQRLGPRGAASASGLVITACAVGRGPCRAAPPARAPHRRHRYQRGRQRQIPPPLFSSLIPSTPPPPPPPATLIPRAKAGPTKGHPATPPRAGEPSHKGPPEAAAAPRGRPPVRPRHGPPRRAAAGGVRVGVGVARAGEVEGRRGAAGGGFGGEGRGAERGSVVRLRVRVCGGGGGGAAGGGI